MSKQLNTLTTEEIEIFLAGFAEGVRTPKQMRRGVRNRTIALLMLEAGLRVGEVTKLRIPDLVYNSQPVTSIIIETHISKNGRERQIPVSGRLSAALSESIAMIWQRLVIPEVCSAFFTNTPTKTLSIRQIERMVQMNALLTIRRKIHPHALRHTFASRLMRKTNARVVQELLGHRNITSTQIYCHPNHEDLTNAINSVSPTRKGFDHEENRNTTVD